MRILIVDDSALVKCEWIINQLETKNLEYGIALNMEEAWKLLEEEKNNGIILDLQFPISKEIFLEGKRTGEIFLQELNRKNIQIPVLGNSTVSFSNVEYPLFYGQMNMFHTLNNVKKLNEFLKSIKE